MAEQVATVVPGVDVAYDEQAHLLCPVCSSSDLTITTVQSLPSVTWVNHSALCGSCTSASTLALVSAFGHVVLRWLPAA